MPTLTTGSVHLKEEESFVVEPDSPRERWEVDRGEER